MYPKRNFTELSCWICGTQSKGGNMNYIKYVVSLFLIAASLHIHGEESTPTVRFLTTHHIDLIKPYMKNMGVTEEHVYAFKAAIAKESDEGFFGYHGTSREFRIYQDIIRMAMEEILEIPIRDNFHFLRIPGDPSLDLLSADDYLDKASEDTLPEEVNESRYYIPMNIALYENFYFEELSSIAGFTKQAHHDIFEKKLVPFFNRLGIDPKHIHKAFEIGRGKLPNKGVLLQFFDKSHYALADKFAYCSLSNGKQFYPGRKPSEFILNPQQTAFPHLRFVINNFDVLNPKGSLVVLRYDLNSDYVRQAYEDALRKYIKSLPKNSAAVKEYKDEITSQWGM